HGAFGYPQDQVSALGAAAVGARARLAAARAAHRPPVKVQQGGDAGVDLDDHVAAAAAVSAVGTAQRLELLPVNRGATVPAVACLDTQPGLISEFRHGFTLSCPPEAVRADGGPPRRACLGSPFRASTRQGRTGCAVRPWRNALLRCCEQG